MKSTAPKAMQIHGSAEELTIPDPSGAMTRTDTQVTESVYKQELVDIMESSPSIVKEDRCGTAQSFLDLASSPRQDCFKYSSLRGSQSGYPCNGFVKHPLLEPWGNSKTYSINAMPYLIDWYPESVLGQVPQAVPPKCNAPGEAPLEKMPFEVLEQIFEELALDIPPTDFAPRNVDLVSCLLTSWTLHISTISTLYKHVTVPHSTIFPKFLNQLSQYPALGTMVRRLDFSYFTSIGLKRSRQMSLDMSSLTSQSLLRCLELTPYVQEILLQEHLEDDLDETVLRKILYGLPNLQAVDFCASSSMQFVEAFTSSLMDYTFLSLSPLTLQRLSLHECFTLPSTAFEALFPLLPRLTHLDVAHTRVSDDALFSIPSTADLTHLNLARCSNITGEAVVDFLTTHPSTVNLVYLNLCSDVTRPLLLWKPDVDRLLPYLPSTLRSLNLNGARIDSSHVSLLLPLTKHLEELSLGSAHLSMDDINTFFLPQPDDATFFWPDQDSNYSPISSIISHTAVQQDNWEPPTLRYLDLSGIPSITQRTLFSDSCILLSPTTSPLEVLELGCHVIALLRECKNTNRRLGWVIKELGRRGWYVREPSESGKSADSGAREWKIGARWWGMRKTPVAWSEVGGLYGHYMFKK